jgi:hypothetical protein
MHQTGSRGRQSLPAGPHPMRKRSGAHPFRWRPRAGAGERTGRGASIEMASAWYKAVPEAPYPRATVSGGFDGGVEQEAEGGVDGDLGRPRVRSSSDPLARETVAQLA